MTAARRATPAAEAVIAAEVAMVAAGEEAATEMKTTLALFTLLLAGCASLPSARWKNIGDQPPSGITAAGPANCPHPGVTWSAWQTVTIGALVKNTRVRECRACGWVQIQSEIPNAKP